MLVQVFTRSHGATETRSFEYVPTNQFMPKRYKHLFEQIVSLENLFAAARKAMRGKRGKAPAAACFADLRRWWSICTMSWYRAIRTPIKMGRMDSARIGLQWSFVETQPRVVFVALRRGRCA